MVFVHPQKVILVACASKKLQTSAKARDLYISTLFKYSLAYAESLKPNAIFILSAKHGLVHPDWKLAPYDETLNMKKEAIIEVWAKNVLSQLCRVSDLETDEFILLAGERYRKFIVPHLCHAKIPLAGLGIGRQLQFLKRAFARSV
jgi:hypothetical protein